MRLLPDLLPRHRPLGRYQDHEETKARVRGEEGAGGDGRQVLHIGECFLLFDLQDQGLGQAIIFVCGPHWAFRCATRAKFKSNMPIQS